MRRLWYHFLHSILPLGALGLHLVIFVSYARRWDKLAALTIFPFWAWGLLGFGMAGFAWLLTRQRLALGVAGLWMVTLIGFSDETRPLLRTFGGKPEPGLPALSSDGQRVLRVVTLNCKAGFFNPSAVREVIPWKPDVVLFQETASLQVLQKLAQEMYGGLATEHATGNHECGIITRGQIRNSMHGNLPNSLSALIRLEDGRELMVASVHLSAAETDVRLYTREALYKHAVNRLARRAEMQRLVAVQMLMNGQRPALIGGDFNAPAGDAVFRLLSSAGFTDAMAAVGAGWPNTYPNQAPMLRIDHQWSSPRLQPLRARVVKSVHSDHRMLVCDYLLK